MSSAERLASTLIAAYKSGRRVPVDADAQALTLAEAMPMQATIAAGIGAAVGGWKVAIPNGAPGYAPMFAANIRESGSRWAIPQEGFLVEIELAFTLKSDLPVRPGRPYSRDEVLAALDHAVVGIELIASRFEKSPPTAPFPAWLADNMGNAGYVTGAAIPVAAFKDMTGFRTVYRADGVVAQEVTGHPLGDPLAPIVACASDEANAFGGFKAGQIVTTGSLTTPKVFNAPVRLTASIEGLGEVAVDIG